MFFFLALAVILLPSFVPLFKKWPKPCNNRCSLRHQERPSLFRKTANPMRTPELHLRRLSWHQVRLVLTTYCCCELEYPDSNIQDFSFSTTSKPKPLLSIKDRGNTVTWHRTWISPLCTVPWEAVLGEVRRKGSFLLIVRMWRFGKFVFIRYCAVVGMGRLLGHVMDFKCFLF